MPLLQGKQSQQFTCEQGTGDGQANGDAGIGDDETFWNEKIPFNKSGIYFLNGWNANATESNALIVAFGANTAKPHAFQRLLA